MLGSHDIHFLGSVAVQWHGLLQPQATQGSRAAPAQIPQLLPGPSPYSMKDKDPPGAAG